MHVLHNCCNLINSTGLCRSYHHLRLLYRNWVQWSHHSFNLDWVSCCSSQRVLSQHGRTLLQPTRRMHQVCQWVYAIWFTRNFMILYLIDEWLTYIGGSLHHSAFWQPNCFCGLYYIFSLCQPLCLEGKIKYRAGIMLVQGHYIWLVSWISRPWSLSTLVWTFLARLEFRPDQSDQGLTKLMEIKNDKKRMHSYYAFITSASQPNCGYL